MLPSDLRSFSAALAAYVGVQENLAILPIRRDEVDRFVDATAACSRTLAVPPLYVTSRMGLVRDGYARDDGLVARDIFPVEVDHYQLLGVGQAIKIHDEIPMDSEILITRSVATVEEKDYGDRAMLIVEMHRQYRLSSGRVVIDCRERFAVRTEPQTGPAREAVRPTGDSAGGERWPLRAREKGSQGALIPDRAIARSCMTPTELQLFRFSAATWNGHRLHYDKSWAREEGYRDVLVQSQLHGCLLARAAMSTAGDGGRLRELRWRNIAPAYPGSELCCAGTLTGREELECGQRSTWDLKEVNSEGVTCVTGSAVVDQLLNAT